MSYRLISNVTAKLPTDLRLPALSRPAEQSGDSLTLTLPLPGRPCNPNVRGHWSKRAKAIKTLREAAYMVARTAHRCFERPEVSAVFYGRTCQTRDRDNAIASLKGAIDGLADARLFANDSAVRWGDVEFEKDAADPRVVLTIKETP